MTQIILDANLASKLHELGHVAELCDPAGRVVGRFVPADYPPDWETWVPDVSEEELQRRESFDKRYTTEQVLAHLRNMEKP